MSLGQLNSFTIGGVKEGMRVSNIHYAKQRYKAGVHNDTILMTEGLSGRPLDRVEVGEDYSSFLALGLGQFVNVTEVNHRGIESPVAINVFNIDSYRAFGASYTLVILKTGRRFKIKLSLTAFETAYAGAMSSSSIDFSDIPEYPSPTEANADAGLELGEFYRIDGSAAGLDEGPIYQKL